MLCHGLLDEMIDAVSWLIRWDAMPSTRLSFRLSLSEVTYQYWEADTVRHTRGLWLSRTWGEPSAHNVHINTLVCLRCPLDNQAFVYNKKV